MPEPPDFEQLARAIVDDDTHELPFERALAEQLRLIWNARGAADRATIKAALAAKTDLPPWEQLLALDR